MELKTLNLIENPTLPDAQNETAGELRKRHLNRFLERQFDTEVTKNQKIFDAIFGVILPVICFFFDPIIFRGYGALLGTYKPFVYLLSYVSIMGLMAFMIWEKKLGWFNGILSGLFAVSSIISIGVGIALFPISLVGLLFIIGALGFTPLFTGFVFWRNAVRAYKAAKPILGAKALVSMIMLSAILSFTIPEIINVKIHRGLETIKHGDAQTIRRTAKRLKIFSPLINRDFIRREYLQTYSDSSRREALEEAFQELGGKRLKNGILTN